MSRGGQQRRDSVTTEIARQYRPGIRHLLLPAVRTIASESSDLYGIYLPSQRKKKTPPAREERYVMVWGAMDL